MKTLSLGKSGIEISSIIMGMWQAGKQYWTGIDDNSIQEAISAALDSGVNTFDTAEEYGEGYSEQMLGKALKGRREKAVILTKVFSNHLKYEQVIEACHRSLKNLGTDYIDNYQIHWPSGSWESEKVPIEKTMRALEDLKRHGKIRSIGVSNFSLAQLQEVGAIDSLQSPYSLFWRHIEKEITHYCHENQITVFAYSPLAQGVLTGKFRPGHVFERGDNRKSNKLVDEETFPMVEKALSAILPIAQSRNTTITQLALAWVIAHRQTAAITGVRNAAQIVENAKAAQLKLGNDEIVAMETAAAEIARKFIDDPVPWFWNP